MTDRPFGGSTTNENRIIRLIASGRAWCLLCGQPPAAFGFWRPDPATARLFSMTAAKPVTITYALCSACVRLPDPTRRIEDAILADIASVQ